mgnify:CR=1 FL=1
MEGGSLFNLKPSHKDALVKAVDALPKTDSPVHVDLPSDSPEDLMRKATESGYIVRLDMDDTEETREK